MKKRRNKPDELRVYMTPEQKNRLRHLAEIDEKTMSEFVLDAALNAKNDSSKSKNQSLDSDMINVRKSLYIMTRLMLLVGSEQLKSQETIMKFYRETKEEAEKAFAAEGE